MALLTMHRSDFQPLPAEEDGEVYQAAMLCVHGAEVVNSVCVPVGPEPERDYPWDDRIAEVRELWGDQSGISPEQQQVVVDILIGFRELSDNAEQYDTYEGLTRMLRAISTIADPMDDVEWIVRRVGEWLHEQLPEDAFREHAHVAGQTHEVDDDSDSEPEDAFREDADVGVQTDEVGEHWDSEDGDWDSSENGRIQGALSGRVSVDAGTQTDE